MTTADEPPPTLGEQIKVLFGGTVAPPDPWAPDLPCPKCGGNDTAMRYCDGCNQRPALQDPDDRCGHGDPEHFHRNCRRCSYRWRTDDVIDARVVCAE